jgi:leukotriene-A4 hydrolase
MRIDPHSYAESDQAVTKHLDLDLRVDFARKVLSGTATLSFAAPASGPLDLDSRGLKVASALTDDGRPVPFSLGEPDVIMGTRLRLTLPAATRAVTIQYETSPDAVALQWLDPVQTEGRKHPFLFSQCQAIHARTVVPLQDTPRLRVTYDAAITVPQPLNAVMSAGPAGERPGPEPGTRTLLFTMPQPIPPYLFALAVGNLASADLSPRARVWAEPETVKAAAWEFEGVEHMIVTAEKLFGAYEWDRYDMLVLPPSFPYGGMENPRMTFLTPTLLAGDRSLVDVVAHELAHSWTGNLVTNANAEHFWLNEGFTTYAERRIVEALHGEKAAALAWAIGEHALTREFDRFGKDSDTAKLRVKLDGVDPDDVFSSIPYEKGARFLALLERTVGRPRFDAFIHEYIERFRFTSITTEEFLAFVDERLPGASAKVGAQEWLYEAGLPANAPVFVSETLEGLSALAGEWTTGARPGPDQVKGWSTTELLVYLQKLPRPLPVEDCAWLDQTFQLTKRGNYEILVEWLDIALSSDYEPAFDRTRQVLMRVGRMKYLRPLFKAMGKNARTRALARDIFAAAAPGYHSLSRRAVESTVNGYPE